MNWMFLIFVSSFLLIGQSYGISSQQVNSFIEFDEVKAASYYPRSCHHIKNSGGPPAQESGFYWIDPDGAGIGDGPILVECNMTTGVTSVPHNAEEELQVPVCPDEPECHKIDIAYQNASLRQLKALAEISQECRQAIEIDCLRGPFMELDADGQPTDKAYTWWLDRNENNQYFWSGSNDAVHTCQCGIDENCLASYLKCNCDANVAIPMTDSGIITNKDLLPIKGLRFSNTMYEGGSHKVGRFECLGLKKLETKPNSCMDLWLLGQTVNGYYIFHEIRMVDVKFTYKYCNFLDAKECFVEETTIGVWPGTES